MEPTLSVRGELGGTGEVAGKIWGVGLDWILFGIFVSLAETPIFGY